MRRWTVAVATLVLLVTATPSVHADWPRRWSYTGWVADIDRDAPERVMVDGSAPTLRFKARRTDVDEVTYRVCWSDGDGEHRHCRRRRTTHYGESALVVAGLLSIGPQIARWYVDGNQVATWRWYFAPEDLE